MALTTIELIIGVAVILASALGLWVNLNNEYTKLKARVYQLERSDSDLKTFLVDISARLHAIELLLASNQIKEK
jgi:hypothetical protein